MCRPTTWHLSFKCSNPTYNDDTSSVTKCTFCKIRNSIKTVGIKCSIKDGVGLITWHLSSTCPGHLALEFLSRYSPLFPMTKKLAPKRQVQDQKWCSLDLISRHTWVLSVLLGTWISSTYVFPFHQLIMRLPIEIFTNSSKLSTIWHTVPRRWLVCLLDTWVQSADCLALEWWYPTSRNHLTLEL